MTLTAWPQAALEGDAAAGLANQAGARQAVEDYNGHNFPINAAWKNSDELAQVLSTTTSTGFRLGRVEAEFDGVTAPTTRSGLVRVVGQDVQRLRDPPVAHDRAAARNNRPDAAKEYWS